MISEDEIILLKNIVQKSQNNKGYVLKYKNGKIDVGESLIELFKKVINVDEIKFLLTNLIEFNEKEINYIKKYNQKDFKIYVLNDNELIEYKI